MPKIIVILYALLSNCICTETYGQLNSNILFSNNINEIFLRAKQYSGLGGVYDDTAQKLIYRAAEINILNKDDTIDYYFQTLQTEIFYYAGLYQFGINSANIQIEKALQLKDSVLIGSAYFFKAINLLELDSFFSTKTNLDLALSFYPKYEPTKNYKKIAYYNQIINVYAETFYEQKKFAEALYYNKLALQNAYGTASARGIPAPHLVQGKIFFDQKNMDSALWHFNKTLEQSIYFRYKDLQLVAIGKLMLVMHISGKKTSHILNKGLALIENEGINNSFKVFFYKDAIQVSKLREDKKSLMMLQDRLLMLKEQDMKIGNSLVQNLSAQMLDNQKRVLGLEVQEAQRKQQLATTQLILALGSILLLTILFLLYRYYQKQKNQLNIVRQNISKDLHDDVGASLSSLQIYSTVATKSFKEQPEKTLDMLQKITIQSKQVMENMNDIVWSMNINKTNPISLEAKVKNYSVELLSSIEINFVCKIEVEIEQQLKSITAKRNILLIILEALNNIAKYSKATNASLEIFLQNKKMMMHIKDDGIGFDVLHKKQGNGIYNMQKRVEELGGNFDINATMNNGVIIIISIPIKSL